MLKIETTGTWREMGRQIGEEFREYFEPLMQRCCPRLLAEPDKYAPAVAKIYAAVAQHAPELLEETWGLAEATGYDRDTMLGYRFFNMLRFLTDQECSAIYVTDGDPGPLMGYNCDLSPDIVTQAQLLRVCRPTDGVSSIGCSYLGTVGGYGVSEQGLAISGTSAHTTARYGPAEMPLVLLLHLFLSRCQNIAQVCEMAARHKVMCKPCNILVGDAQGKSVVLEFAFGRCPVQAPRPADCDWQVRTNFFLSGEIPIQAQPEYLAGAYARYGRLVHQLEANTVSHDVDGLKQLITDVAQPGLCCPGGENTLSTAYSQVMDLANRTMHLCPGNPGQLPHEEISL
jgi:predicted choloylglycine hydrolase